MKRVGGSVDTLSRRGFLKISAIWAGGAWLVGVPDVLAFPYQVFSTTEAEIMNELADCIIPPDEFYGGKDALVTRFIDRQLGRYGYLQHDKEMYQICLPALNRNSTQKFGRVFIHLGEDEKISYLSEIESGVYNSGSRENGWGDFSPSSFFNTMRNQCMMGYYGSPDHGGNKDYVSYRMLGLI